jgi:hypothetical protein
VRRTMTSEMESVLLRLWSEGLSGGQVGDALRLEFPRYAGSLTKNAVAGHMLRMRARGLDAPPRRIVTADGRGGRVVRMLPRAVKSAPVRAVRAEPVRAEPAEDAFAPPPGKRLVPLSEIGFWQCRWPYDAVRDGLPVVMYCGDLVRECSLCGPHYDRSRVRSTYQRRSK